MNFKALEEFTVLERMKNRKKGLCPFSYHEG